MNAVAKAVVIGVGNDFRHDDGAGPAVVDRLAARRDALTPAVRLAVSDGEPTRMIELWEGAALAIVIDAAAADPESGVRPGDILRWEVSADDAGPADPDAPASPSPALRSDSAGTHALGPGTAISLARVLGRLPDRLLIFAVAGSDFANGLGLSGPVADATVRLAEEVLTELSRARVFRPGRTGTSGGARGPGRPRS